MNVHFVNYDRAYLAHKEEFDSEMQRVLSSGDLILREDVEKFEENLAKFVGTKYAVGLSSGTDALYLALKALNLKGKRVAVPSHTFKATAGAVVNSGAIPVVYDMDDIYPLADVYILVHIAGELSDIPTNEVIIEDAAQALGSVKNPTSDAQCWSFYPAKILGAFGDAGALTTNDENIYQYVKEARNHFKGTNEDFGGNHRMDNIQAAILNVKFKYLPLYLKRRKEVAEKYLSLLWDLPLMLPNNDEERVWQDFIVNVGIKRDELYEFLKKEGIEVLRNEYPFPAEYPKLPLAAKYEAETLRLPCNENLTDEEIDYVIKKIREFYGNGG